MATNGDFKAHPECVLDPELEALGNQQRLHAALRLCAENHPAARNDVLFRPVLPKYHAP
jgi:hypothetical protein